MNPPQHVPPELANHPAYADVRFLGSGGMGVVYLARNRFLDRLEVLKVLNSSYANNERVRQRFLREVQIAARLHHPHVAMVYSAFPLTDTLVMAMEYVPGENLAELVKRDGPLSVQKACAFAYQAAIGLQHAHDRGLVHRDIKPGNIIGTEQGKKKLVKIIDFGLAKAEPGKFAAHDLTKACSALGTPAFMAPEQARNAAGVDGRADLYSLGATLYFLLVGHPPIVGDNDYDHVIRLVTEEPVAVRTLRPDVPCEVADIITKLLQKDPRARYQTPADVADTLLPFAKRKTTALKPAPMRADCLQTYPQSQTGSWVDESTGRLERDWTEYVKQAKSNDRDRSYSLPENPVWGWEFLRERDSVDVTRWRLLAEKGEPRAMHLYACCLEGGIGIPTDEHLAIRWHWEAAELGDVYAMHSRGWHAKQGWGKEGFRIERSEPWSQEEQSRYLTLCEEEQVHWYRKAADLGHAAAAFDLGLCYETIRHRFPARSIEEAARWYRVAAERGHSSACYFLSCFYDRGMGGLVADSVQSMVWCRKAADLGEKQAMSRLIQWCKHGVGLSAPDIREANYWQTRFDEKSKDTRR